MKELLQNTPLSLSIRNPDGYIKTQMTIKAVGGYRFLYKMNNNITPTNRMRLRKRKQKNQDSIKINIQKANAHWNDWKFKLYWNSF